MPVICNDESFDFPVTIISKLKGVKWTSPNVDEEVDLGDVKVQRKNFGTFKDIVTIYRYYLNSKNYWSEFWIS